jgi:hypothetical protein
MRLTNPIIKKLPLPEHGNRLVFDDAVIGFGIRITAKGSRNFIFCYRCKTDGQEHRMTIGAFGVWSTTRARAEAARLKLEVDCGGNPASEDAFALSIERRVASKALAFLEQGIEISIAIIIRMAICFTSASRSRRCSVKTVT